MWVESWGCDDSGVWYEYHSFGGGLFVFDNLCVFRRQGCDKWKFRNKLAGLMVWALKSKELVDAKIESLDKVRDLVNSQIDTEKTRLLGTTNKE